MFLTLRPRAAEDRCGISKTNFGDYTARTMAEMRCAKRPRQIENGPERAALRSVFHRLLITAVRPAGELSLMPLSVALAILMRPAMRLRDLGMHRHHWAMLEARRRIHERRIRMNPPRVRLRVPVAVATIVAVVRRAIAIGRVILIMLIALILLIAPIAVLDFAAAIIRFAIAVVPIPATIIAIAIAIISIVIAISGRPVLMRPVALFAEHQPIWMGLEL